jgi:amidase
MTDWIRLNATPETVTMQLDETDIAYLPAHRQLDLFATGELSPRDVVSAQIKRAEVLNHELVAFGDCCFEQALKQAAKAEAQWRRGKARPLEGITLAVKDAQNIAGQRTTYGSLAFRDNIAETTDPMIQRLLNAGVILVGRTTTSELCISGVNRSSVWGLGRNPWNRAYSPGGSSGGSAAALAAGLVTLATGTDMGGSIRVPASACGLAGYKPPHGRNPDSYPHALDLFCVCGPLARTAVDVVHMQNVTAGRHWQDHHSLPAPPPLDSAVTSVDGLRIACSIDLSYRRIDPEVRQKTLDALACFRRLGCIATEVNLGWTDEIDADFGHWIDFMWTGRTLVSLLETSPDLLPHSLKSLARVAQRRKPEDLLRVYRRMQLMNERFGQVMSAHDIFICPTMAVPAVKADQDIMKGGLLIDGEEVDAEFGYSMTHQFNMLGYCPVVSVASGLSSSGIPTGLQIVGRPFDDATVIKAALAFEAERGPWFGSSRLRPPLS